MGSQRAGMTYHGVLLKIYETAVRGVHLREYNSTAPPDTQGQTKVQSHSGDAVDAPVVGSTTC